LISSPPSSPPPHACFQFVPNEEQTEYICCFRVFAPCPPQGQPRSSSRHLFVCFQRHKIIPTTCEEGGWRKESTLSPPPPGGRSFFFLSQPEERAFLLLTHYTMHPGGGTNMPRRDHKKIQTTGTLYSPLPVRAPQVVAQARKARATNFSSTKKIALNLEARTDR